jgi:hypothetical protein
MAATPVAETGIAYVELEELFTSEIEPVAFPADVGA